jgi:hypothetical protein
MDRSIIFMDFTERTLAGPAAVRRIIGGWLEIVQTTVTRTPRHCTRSILTRADNVLGQAVD